VTVPQGWEVKTFEEYQRLEGLPPSEGSEAAMTVGVDVKAVVGKSEGNISLIIMSYILHTYVFIY
jgi:hypothetical protein